MTDPDPSTQTTSSTDGLAPDDLFDIGDYPDWITGLGADKLRSSAVAPLVAAARGYQTASDRPEMKTFVDAHRLSAMKLLDGRSTNGKKVADGLDSGGILAIPMFDAADVLDVRSTTRATLWQFRPDQPYVGKDGRPQKYIFPAGAQTPLDVHPSTPLSWTTNPNAIVITEGTIKVDSGITAVLRNAGVGDDVLATVGKDIDTSRAMLSKLMNEQDADNRILIVGVAGVGNWHSHPGWNSLPLKDNSVYVGFDGDAVSNPAVWRQADAMFRHIERRNGTPHYINLTRVTRPSADSDPIVDNLGLDDWLAEVGPWSSLSNRMSTELPESPIEAVKGEWRVFEGTEHVVKEYVVEDGDSGQGHWEQRFPVAGRVVRIDMTRSARRQELETGSPLPDIEADVASNVLLELSWMLPGETSPSTANVTGPTSLLSEQPERWGKAGALIPSEVHRHPEWPPVGMDGRKWLRAVKTNRAEETEMVAAWDHMGWVPTKRDHCVFIVGEQVVGPDGIDSEQVLAVPGVTESVTRGSSKMGVHLPADRDEAVSDIADLLATYVGAFDDHKVAAAVLAAGLRPAVPSTKVPVGTLLSGPPQSGKSFAAAAAMVLWAARPGNYTHNSLPGSANDTAFTMEHSMATTMIHVVDDLAPSVDARKAQQAEHVISQLLRDAHNRTARGRMNPDGTQRKPKIPRAALIVTAENSPTITSALDRAVHISLAANGLDDHGGFDALVKMRDESKVPARVAGALIRWLAQFGRREGWPVLVDFFDEQYKDLEHRAKEIISSGKGGTRHSEMAANMALGLRALGLYCATELEEPELADKTDDLVDDLFQLLHDHHIEQAKRTPGQSLLEALRALLSAGSAHVTSAVDDPIATAEVKDGNVIMARKLGWNTGGALPDRPNGEVVGTVIIKTATDKAYVLFDRDTAFNAARRYHPELVPPGQKAQSSWESMWDQGLAAVDVWTRRQLRSGKEGITVQVMVHGDRKEGIPVDLGILLSDEADEDINQND